MFVCLFVLLSFIKMTLKYQDFYFCRPLMPQSCVRFWHDTMYLRVNEHEAFFKA